MSDFGLLSVNLDKTSTHLREFSNAIDYLRKNSDVFNDDFRNAVKNLSEVLIPLNKLVQGELPRSITLDEESIMEILQQKHSDNWQLFKNLISTVTKKLEKHDTVLNPKDIECLDDVADALDTECSQLFMRLKG